MDVKEAAERLNLRVDTVYGLCREKRLGHRRMGPRGGIIDITPEHIEAFLKACEVPVKTEQATQLTQPRQKTVKKIVHRSRIHREPTAAEVIAKHRGKKAVRK